jgi:hypothetical protein
LKSTTYDVENLARFRRRVINAEMMFSSSLRSEFPTTGATTPPVDSSLLIYSFARDCGNDHII